MLGQYTEQEFAMELKRIATGTARYGNTPMAPALDPQDQALLERFATGQQGGDDSVQLKALSEKRYDPTIDWLGMEPPADVVAAAKKVGRWFADRNIRNWTLGVCESRSVRHSTMSIMLTPDSGAA